MHDPLNHEILTHCVVPIDIGRAAEECPALYACYQAWRRGHFTWEQAMTTAAHYLAIENARLRNAQP
jgi:hypothetical protein